MNKKLVLSVLSTAVVASMAASAMAKPNAGFYVGGNVDKYYSIDAFINHLDTALDEILDNLDSTTFVDENGKAAPFLSALNAQTEEELNAVTESARLDHFEKNPYTIVDGTGAYNPEEDEDLLPPVDGGELKVESVSAINATQLKVVFTTEVDKATAENPDSYSFDGKLGGTDNFLKATGGAVLQSDNKTVILSLDPATYTYTKGKSWAVVVDGVQKKNDSSVVIPKWAGTVSLDDTAAPSIAEVTSVANGTTNTVTVKFSEPVAGVGTYKIDGVTATRVLSPTNPYVVTLTTGAGQALEAGKTYTLTVVNEEDLATVSGHGNKVTTTKSFTVTGDSVAEGVKSTTVIDDNKLLIEFNDDVNPATVIPANVKVLDENASVLTGGYTVSQPDPNDDTKFLVTLTAANLFGSSNTRDLTLVVTDSVLDSQGNKVAPTTKAFKVTKDVTKPVAQSARVLKDTSGKITGFEITFDSNLAVGTATTTGIRVINAAGKEITTTLGLGTSTGSVVADDQNKLVVSLPTPVSLSSDVSGNVTVILPASLVTDDSYSKNASTGKNLSVNLGTASTAKMTASIANGVSDNVIEVTFSEAVKTGDGADSATNPSNYKLNDVALPANTIITYDSTNKKVVIELPDSFVGKDEADAVFSVSGVKSADGTKTVEATTDLVTTVDKVAPVLESAKFLSDTQIELTFSEAMEDPAGASVGGEFLIKQGSTALNIADADLTATAVSGYAKKIVLTYTGQFDLSKSYTITTVDDTTNGNDITDKVDNGETPNAQEADITVSIAK